MFAIPLISYMFRLSFDHLQVFFYKDVNVTGLYVQVATEISSQYMNILLIRHTICYELKTLVAGAKTEVFFEDGAC